MTVDSHTATGPICSLVGPPFRKPPNSPQIFCRRVLRVLLICTDTRTSEAKGGPSSRLLAGRIATVADRRTNSSWLLGQMKPVIEHGTVIIGDLICPSWPAANEQSNTVSRSLAYCACFVTVVSRARRGYKDHNCFFLLPKGKKSVNFQGAGSLHKHAVKKIY